MSQTQEAAFQYRDTSHLTRLVGRRDPNEVLAEIKGKPFREYRAQWEAANVQKITTPFPIEIGFDLLFACNLRCVGCYFSEDTPNPEYLTNAKPMPLDAYKQIIDDGVRHGLKSVYFGYASEITMNRRYMEYVRYAATSGIVDTWFGTNGILLSRDAIDEIIDLGVTRVLISIDAATKDTFERVRVRGNYEKLIANLEYLIERRKQLGSRLPLIRLSMNVNRINEHEVGQFIDQWIDRVDYVDIQNFIAMDGLTEKFFPSTQQGAGGVLPKSFSCPQPFQRLFINANGDSYPCCSFENMYSKELLLGNALKTPVQEIWTSAKIEDLRDAHRTNAWQRFHNCTTCAKSSF
jgi:radical SAM protein with 4Fe4S-binding SPASM domain